MDEEKLKKYVEQRSYYDQEGYKQSCRNRLRNLISKKMRTMMIGFLAEMEKCMGENWGHGQIDGECTDEQLDKKAIWKMCRNNVLDYGNKQIRAIEQELEDYIVELRKKQFLFRKNQTEET